jgi:hypothetical protein
LDPIEFVAATVRTFVQLAGDVPEALVLALPAAATTNTPAAATSFNAVCTHAWQLSAEERLRLTTRAGYWFAGTPGTLKPAAQRTPAMTSAIDPPQVPSARTDKTLLFGAVPATPVPFPATAATTPVTCVPCHDDDDVATQLSKVV